MTTACASCGSTAISVRDELDTLVVGVAWEQQEQVTLTVPVWTCLRCGLRWTDDEAERLRDEATAGARARRPWKGLPWNA
jgi:hypothetical protein